MNTHTHSPTHIYTYYIMPCNGYKALIRMHEMHDRMQGLATNLLTHDPLSSSPYPGIDHPHPFCRQQFTYMCNNYETLIVGQWPTSTYICTSVHIIYSLTHIHVYISHTLPYVGLLQRAGGNGGGCWSC